MRGFRVDIGGGQVEHVDAANRPMGDGKVGALQ